MLHWSSPTLIFTGNGLGDRFDPGVGPGRYQRAADWLESIQRDRAFASFTFDLEQPGSVVMSMDGDASIPDGNGVDQGARVASDGRSGWESGFTAMTAALADGDLRKVVLARQVGVAASSPIDVGTVLHRLITRNPHTYVFAIDGLVGASPELLISVESGRVRSVALAGTSVGTENLGGPRITLEHDLSAESVADGLGPYTGQLATLKSVLHVGQIHHLATTFTGETRPGIGVLDILPALHPTAAVAGTPTGRALDLIKAHEPRGRGRYAGPVGWFDRHGNGEFAIALRCGWIDGDRATLYAGGGLVLGSDIDVEWAETEAKLVPMLDALEVV